MQQIRDCMSREVVTVGPEESAAVAARLMARYNLGALPVQAFDGSLCGMVTDRDLVLRCMALERPAASVPVVRVMSNHVTAVTPSETVEQAAACMARAQIRRLPVVEGRRLVGIVTLSDLSGREGAPDTAETLREITANVRQL